MRILYILSAKSSVLANTNHENENLTSQSLLLDFFEGVVVFNNGNPLGMGGMGTHTLLY